MLVLMEDDSTKQQSTKSYLKVSCLKPANQIVWGFKTLFLNHVSVMTNTSGLEL
jgi:hypothetical protein